MESNIREALRRKINSIAPISHAEFEQSVLLFRRKEIGKGHFFVEEGNICNDIGFIGKGILRTFTTNESGNEATICFCPEHRFTTSFRSFVSRSQSKLSIQAVEDSELLTLDYNDLDWLYENTKAWPKIGRILAEREYLNMESYALGLNQQTAQEKYIRLLEEQPSVVQRVPIQQIASFLGVTRETLSRIRNQVANDYVTIVK